jgi:hypothetical protein
VEALLLSVRVVVALVSSGGALSLAGVVEAWLSFCCLDDDGSCAGGGEAVLVGRFVVDGIGHG